MHDRSLPPNTWDGHDTAFQIDGDRYGMWTDINGQPKNRETGEPITAATAKAMMEWHWSESLGRWHPGLVGFTNRGASSGHELVSADPLTISPSLLCRCGDHGWLRDGRWIPA